MNMAQWLSWLERRPVTAEVESSSLFWVVHIWGLSSAGRASALQAEGHRFEPYRPHSHVCVRNAAVAEQADAQDLKSCGTYTPVPVRFRSAAVGKSERNVEFTAFLLFFCFKKLMKLDLIDSVAMEEVAGFLDKLLSKDKYEGRREANMKYVVE